MRPFVGDLISHVPANAGGNGACVIMDDLAQAAACSCVGSAAASQLWFDDVMTVMCCWGCHCIGAIARDLSLPGLKSVCYATLPSCGSCSNGGDECRICLYVVYAWSCYCPSLFQFLMEIA